MRRGLVLGALVAVGALSIGVAAGQQAPAELTVEKVKDNLFVLRGGGGNTAVFVTADGVVVVDAKDPGMGQPILDKIKELTPKPVTTLINTHWHGDHVGGNVQFPSAIDIVAHANARVSLRRNRFFEANNGVGMPKRIFRDQMSIGSGPDQIDLYYFGRGHTNGDAWVVFPALRTMHSGDMFARKSLPGIDRPNGGSQLHYPDTLNRAHAGIKNVDTIINGHTPAQTTFDDLKVFAAFNQEFVKWAQAQLAAGKTPEQAADEWKTPDKYIAEGYAAFDRTMLGGLAGRIQMVADEMKRK